MDREVLPLCKSYKDRVRLDAINQRQSQNLTTEKSADKQLKFYFKLSNRGDMTHLVTTENGFFDFVETCSGMSASETTLTRLRGNYIETVKNRLYWSLTYNKSILRNDVAVFYLNFIDDKIVQTTNESLCNDWILNRV